jgi:hypothetical protein
MVPSWASAGHGYGRSAGAQPLQTATTPVVSNHPLPVALARSSAIGLGHVRSFTRTGEATPDISDEYI